MLLGAGWLLSLFAPLLSPARVLANRDIPLFHLPLRSAFRRLVEQGTPFWNPWIHGGQPVLSNPSYAAFYPPSWLVFLVDPAYALNLLVVLHAAVAFAGAWRLARRLGGSRGAAALAALAYTGGGASLSLISALTLFCSMAWLPWVLAEADAALRAEPGRWLRPALLAGGALSLQLLNGEPATVLMTGLAVLCLAAVAAVTGAAGVRSAAGPDRRGALRVALRCAVPFVVAVLLAAVQLLPTWGRLADSPRAGGLPAARANIWSSPPARLVELAFPRFFGDPVRAGEGLFFGWHLHDRDYPYVSSIYPGLLLAVLGLAAFARWPVPRRGAWALAFALGAFLAVGRHNPLWEPLREAIPPLAVLRFPEKFAILALAGLTFAGALGWGWLLEEREAGRPQQADFPLALSAVLLATAGVLTGLLYALPGAAAWFVRAHGAPTLSTAGAAEVGRAVGYLRGEGWAAVATAAAVTALLALCRWRRPPARLLTALAVALVAVDLWHYGHGLVEVVPSAEYRRRPAVHLAPESRIYVEQSPGDQPDFVPRRKGDDPSQARLRGLRALIDRVEPYGGTLQGMPYALNEDYDLMLTRWASRALDILHEDWKASDLPYRYLGVWNVGTILLRKDPATWAAESARDPAAPLMRELRNPFRLPRLRFVPGATFHGDEVSALAAARAEGYKLLWHEHCVVAPGEAPREGIYSRPPQPLEVEDRPGRLRLRYRAEGSALLILGDTFDPGWRATVDGAPLPLRPTAACQIAVELPPGEHRLEMAYRDPRVAVGAAVTLAALATMAALLLVLGREKRRAAVA